MQKGKKKKKKNHYNHTQEWPGKWNYSLYFKIASSTSPIDSNHI